MDDTVFVELIGRAKGGDEVAIGDLLRHFEEDVRIMVRARLPRALRSQFDSMDFVQAVWQSFFSGWREDPTLFSNSRHLRGFLAGVVRNKVYEEHRRRTRTRKYDLGREERLYVRKGGHDEPREVAAPDPSPSQNAQAHDCWDQLVAGRSPREAEVIDLRRQELTYEEIAQRTGLNERSVRRVIEAIRPRMEDRRWS